MSQEFGKASTLDAIDAIDPIDVDAGGPRGRSDTAVIDDPLLGSLIDDRYRIAMRLGQGGMGIVYEARHEVLGSRLAFKVLRKDAAGDEEAIARLEREAQAASAIGNEHIVDVRDFGRLDDGSVYIVMELIDGADLYALVKRQPIDGQRARDIALQIAEALHAAHEQGIVHRDLKLENVLLTTRRGRADFVKVVDFGIAKVQGGSKLTAAGRVMGTPEYMSPEQCAGKAVDHRTDIYSLGVMLYEMLTQKLPFWDQDLVKLIRAQMYDKPVPPSTLRPDLDIPLELEAIVLRCLAKDPSARFQTMRAVMQALRVGAGEDVLETPASEPSAASDAAPASTVTARSTSSTAAAGSRRWLWAAAAIGALGAAGALGWFVVRDLAPEPTVRAPDPPPLRAPQAPADELAPAAVEPPLAPAVIEAPARSAEILVTSQPAAARVFGDGGAYLGDTPFRLRRPVSGERVALSIRRDGFEPGAVVVSELSNEELRVTLDAARAGVRPRPPPPAERVERPAPEPAEPDAPPRRHQEFLDPWGGGTR